MPEGLRLSREELKSRFGLSSRVVVRIGALLSRGVLLTEAILESLRPGTAAERWLLDPRWLEDGRRVDDATLRALAQDAGVADEFAAVTRGGETVVALREESMADQGYRASAGLVEARDDALATVTGAALTHADVIRRDETSSIFTPQEIGRLKLVLLTGVQPGEKIEALRRLAFAPVPSGEKGLLFVRALTDASAEVRREAAGALRGLGLRPEITEAIQALSLESRDTRRFAVERLTVLFREAPESDRAVIRAVLVSTLRGESDVALQGAILDALTAFAAGIVADAEALHAVGALLVERLATHYEALQGPIRGLLEALGAAAREPVAALLWSEFERTPDRRLRCFLLSNLATLAPTGPARARLAREIAEILKTMPDHESEARRLLADLRGLGTDALAAMLTAIPEAEEGCRVALLRVFDSVTADPALPADAVVTAATALSDWLPAARRQTRMVMMESRFLDRPEIPADLRRRIGADLIGRVHDHGLDVVRDATELALRRLGLPIAEALLAAARDSVYPDERRFAARMLAEVVQAARADCPDESALVLRAAEVVRDRGATDPVLRGAAAVASGRICSHPAIPPEWISALAADVQKELSASRGSLDCLDGLAWIAAAPRCPLDIRMQIGMQLLACLDGDLPAQLAKEIRTRDGMRLEIAIETDAYTAVLPVALAGIERMLLTPGLSELFVERVVGRLIQHWEAVVTYRVVWGPGHVTRLAEALGAFGRAPHAPLHLRVRIVDALRQKMLTLTVIRLVGGVLAVAEEGRELLRACEAVILRLLDMRRLSDFAEAEDQAAIVGSLAQIALRARVCNDPNQEVDLRRRIVEETLEAWTQRVPGAGRWLERLRASESLRPELRELIAKRLAGFPS